MERSLSVLLPVRDAQSTLAADVCELLDILPELTRNFELLIVDDGSRDATIEVADELARSFPQIRVLRHGSPKGRPSAIETGLGRSRGDVVFLRDEGCRLPIDEIGRLWRAMDHHDLVLGRPHAVLEPMWRRWQTRNRSGCSGFQMARRAAIEPVRQYLTDQALLRERLQQLGCRWHEIELRNRLVPLQPAGAGAQAGPRQSSPEAQSIARHTPEASGVPGPPNYLARIKDFALGE